MELDRERISKKRFGKELLNFYDVLKEKYPMYNEYFLIGKLNTVELVSDPKTIRDLISLNCTNKPASYNSIDNKIYLISDHIESRHIYHELFHMLSAYKGKSKDMIYSGFRRTDTNTFQTVGTGINEGYTQLLKERYFGMDKKEENVYLLEKTIMDYLEMIVGQIEMEKYYLWANLEGLIKHLSRYTTFNEIAIFINNIDYIYNTRKNKNNLSNEKIVKMINLRLKDALTFLIDTFIDKQTMLYHREIISGETYKKNIEDFLEDIARPIETRDYTYQALENSDIEKVLYYNSLTPEITR